MSAPAELPPVIELRSDRRLGLLAAALGVLALPFALWSGGPFFIFVSAVVLAVGLWRILDQRVKLRIDDVGVWTSEWGSVTVHWGEIARVEIVTRRGVDQLCIVPHDPAILLDRMPPWFRLASRMTQLVWSSPFVISTTGLEAGTDFVLFAVTQRLAAHRG